MPKHFSNETCIDSNALRAWYKLSVPNRSYYVGVTSYLSPFFLAADRSESLGFAVPNTALVRAFNEAVTL